MSCLQEGYSWHLCGLGSLTAGSIPAWPIPVLWIKEGSKPFCASVFSSVKWGNAVLISQEC